MLPWTNISGSLWLQFTPKIQEGLGNIDICCPKTVGWENPEVFFLVGRENPEVICVWISFWAK